MTAESKYGEKLRTCPAPGGGVNAWVLGVASLAALAAIPAGEAAREIAAAMTRPPRPGEVERAVAKAFRECGTGGGGGTWNPPPKPPKPPRRPAMEKFVSYVAAGRGFGEADLWEESPVRLLDAPGWPDAVQYLGNVFDGGDLVLCLDEARQVARLGKEVRDRDEWIEEIHRRERHGVPLPLFVCPNPLSEKPAMTKDGRASYRAQASVAKFRHCILERDAGSLRAQVAFWAGYAKQWGWERIRAIVYSGGKSLHVVFRVNARDMADWERKVSGRLIPGFAAMGFDPSGRNPVELSRLPGAFRADKGQVQRLLYLASGGRVG